MLTTADRRLTASCAVAVAALSLVTVPLYFVYSGPPPADNVLTRSLLTIAILAAFLIYLTGLRRLLGPAGGLAADIAVVCGQVYAAVTFVAASMETGVALQYPNGSRDPTIDGPLANGMALLHGPIARALIAGHLIALAAAVSRTGALPRWVRTGGIALAAVNLAFVPSLFFGMDPAHFYAANGWGSTASIGSLFLLWTGAVGIAILRRPASPSTAEVTAQSPAGTSVSV